MRMLVVVPAFLALTFIGTAAIADHDRDRASHERATRLLDRYQQKARPSDDAAAAPVAAPVVQSSKQATTTHAKAPSKIVDPAGRLSPQERGDAPAAALAGSSTPARGLKATDARTKLLETKAQLSAKGSCADESSACARGDSGVTVIRGEDAKSAKTAPASVIMTAHEQLVFERTVAAIKKMIEHKAHLDAK